MSALAARRAAQAAMSASASNSAEASPSPAPVQATPGKKAAPAQAANANGKNATPSSSSKPTKQKATPKNTPKSTPKPAPPRSPSPAFDSEASLDLSSDDDDEFGPSQKRQKVSRTKVRYFPAPEDEEVKKGSSKRRKERQFSPSAPQFDVSSDEGSSGDDNDEDDSEIEQEEEYPEVPTGVQTPWSAASPREAGSSRSLPTLRAGTSRFKPREGVNVFRLSEAALSTAGAKVPGPGVIISLSAQDELHIAGAYTITPLRQSVELLSTTIRPAYDGEELESYPVFAPTSHPIPVLRASGNDDLMLESPLMSRLSLPKTFEADSRTIILLQENRCGIEGLRGDVVPGFHNIWVDEGVNPGVWGLRGVHPVFDTFPVAVYPHFEPEAWHQALESLAQHDDADDASDASPQPQDRVPVVVVKGPKRSGKSTIARAALNCLLEQYARVAWLECDLGQGEFGCGGVVGLWVIESPVLGPAFTHPRLPVRAHFLGELSPQSCPDEYMAAIHQLVSHYQYEVQYPLTHTGGTKRDSAVPLVVNTQGWVKGLGEDLMRAIEAAVEPTHVFAFEADQEILPSHAGWTNSPVHQAVDLPFSAPWETQQQSSNVPPAAVFSLEPAPNSPLQARYTAADFRALTTTAYMHARLGDTVHWDFSTPLFAVPPWTVTLGSALSRAYLVGESADAITPVDLHLALNGSLVALIEAPEEDLSSVYVPGTRPPVDDSSLLGLALVRAVRYSEDDKLQLQIVTPLPPAVLTRARAIVRNGALELPTPLLLDFRQRPSAGEGIPGTRWDDMPFFDAADSRAVGGERRRFRRNLQRKGV